MVKKLVKATGAENYNVLQNNGRIAHQEVDHVGLLWEDCYDIKMDKEANEYGITGTFSYGSSYNCE